MGLVASQARYLTLTAYQSDLELQGQFINQSRDYLANVTGSLFTLSEDQDPNSQASVELQSRIAALQTMDKSLELQLRRVDTQRQAVQTEIESVQKVISKNIDSTFKTFTDLG